MSGKMGGVKGQFLSRLEDLADKVLSNAGFLLWDIAVSAVILMAAKGILSIISKVTSHIMHSERYHRTEFQGKRVDTMLTLFRSTVRYLIYFAAIMMILRQFGVGGIVATLLGAAGVGSLAIGFGAQNLVKDVVTGIFMMFENQFGVGDYIKIDDDEGYVTATALRVTYLRSISGDQIIVPNGSINRIVNFTKGSSVANIIVSTAYEADTRAVMDIMQEAMDEFAITYADLIDEPPVVLGIVDFGASSVDIRITCKARPLRHWETERAMRLAIKEKFDRSGVEFPYPHMVTVPYTPSPSEVSSNSGERRTVPDWAGPDEDDDT